MNLFKHSLLIAFPVFMMACGGSPASDSQEGAPSAEGAASGAQQGAGGSSGATTPTTVAGVIASAADFADPGKQPETAIGAPTQATETYGDGSQWTCSVQHYSMKDNPSEFVTMNPTAAVIWPGSLVQGNTLAGGSPEPIAVKRGKGTVLMNLVNSGTGAGAKSYQVKLPEVTQGNVIDAQNQILSNNVGSTPAAYNFELTRVESEEDMAIAMNAKVSWLSGSVDASLKFSQDKHYTRYLVKLTQQYYTMVYETPTSTSDLFDPSVTASDLAKYVGPGNPATYISSVTYGRQFYLLFESTASAQDVEASLHFVYNGVASADVSVQASYKKTESETNIKAWALGGAADKSLDAALSASNGKFDALHDYIVKGANFDAQNPGLPLSYVVRYAGDNKVMQVGIGGEYDKKSCLPVVANDKRTALWLDAATIPAGTTAVSTWKGLTQNQNDATGSARFVANGMNGHPTVAFDGNVNSRLGVDLGSGAVTGDYTVVAVVQTAAPSGAQYFLRGSDVNDKDANLHLGWNAADNFHFGQWSDDLDVNMRPATSGDVIVLRQSKDEGRFVWMDGVYRASNAQQTASLSSNAGASLGCNATPVGWHWSGFTPVQDFDCFAGNISELRVFSYAISDAERRTLECAAGAKWGVGVVDCVNGKPDPAKSAF